MRVAPTIAAPAQVVGYGTRFHTMITSTANAAHSSAARSFGFI